ncbi:MAG: GTP-binding protein, partial [Pseudomonadota bacterium]
AHRLHQPYVVRSQSISVYGRLARVPRNKDGLQRRFELSEFLQQARTLQEVGESLGEEDKRSVTDLLIDQVEFADVILISKTDLVSKEKADELVAVLKTLNTHAKILPIAQGEVDVEQVLNTGLFDFVRAQQAPGWLAEMRGEHVPETEEYGIGSFSYVARRPFNPEKFYQFLHNTQSYGKLIRSKGYFWLASRPEIAGQWSQAGGVARYNFVGYFWKAVPKEHWPTDEEYLRTINKTWAEPFGDMRQELVFIGQGLDQQALTAALDDCLLDESEVTRGMEYWRTLNDPFPAWEAAA